MHERSLLNDLFKKIENVVLDSRAKQATRVTIQLGAFSHISPSHLREHFDQAKPGTVAANAKLEVECTSDRKAFADDIILKSVEVE